MCWSTICIICQFSIGERKWIAKPNTITITGSATLNLPSMSRPTRSAATPASPRSAPQIARPHWPWAPGTYVQRSSPSVASSPSQSTHNPLASSHHDHRSVLSLSQSTHTSRSGTPRVGAQTLLAPSMNRFQGETTRQWSLTVRLSASPCRVPP
mgnify:CR=1 FL=1